MGVSVYSTGSQEGRYSLDGLFYAVVAGRLGGVLTGACCRGAAISTGDTLLVSFGDRPFVLELSAGTESQRIGLGVSAEGITGADEPWDSILAGSSITGVSQYGFDRIILIHLRKDRAYRSSSMTLRFEATGRNSNIILTRDGDGRILACTRNVTGRMSSFRSIAPGAAYVPPPSSGRPPSEWDLPEVRDQLSRASTARVVYGMLEGVGPSTAAAIMAEAQAAGTDPGTVAASLAGRMLEKRFEPWRGPWGPMPARLGPGEPIEDPLTAFDGVRVADVESKVGAFLARNAAASREAADRLAEVGALLDALPGSDTLRLWGQMLLASASRIPRGASEVTLEDWEGAMRTIPLRPVRTAAENAARYFRKAGNIDSEAASLRARMSALEARLDLLRRAAEEAAATGQVPVEKPSVRADSKTPSALPVELSEGWLCWVGRNSKNNEEITFRVGRRGDWWLHARGVPGPHVVLRGEPGRGNPPASVLRKAAEMAAEGAACTSSVVPVDWTLVQHVRRMKGGRPGEVTYTHEKTVFVSPGGEGRDRRMRGRGRAFDTN